MRRIYTAIFLTIFLAACSHGGGSVIPSTNSAMLSEPFAQLNATAGTVQVRVSVPYPPAGLMRPRYVSPSTQSIQITVYNSTGKTLLKTVNADLTKTSPGCAALKKEYVCTLEFAVKAGTDLFNVATYDKTGQRGHVLAAIQTLSQKVVAGQTVLLPLTLGGIAASIEIVPPYVQAVTGSRANGFNLIGGLAHAFTIVPLDADGNMIVGDGAPAGKVLDPLPSSVVVSPPPAGGTQWILRSTFKGATDPTVPKKTSLTVAFAPYPHSGGTPIKTTVALNLYQPWIYVANNAGGTVTAYDEDGVRKTLTGSFSGMTNPSYLTYAPETKYIYATNYAEVGIHVYDVMGKTKATPGGFPGTGNYLGLPAVDTNNDRIYIPDYDNATPPQQMLVYSLQGVRQQIGGGAFAAMANGAWLAAFDAPNHQLFVANWNTSEVHRYNEQGVAQSIPGTFPNVFEPYGMSWDNDDGLLYIGNSQVPYVTVYDGGGNQQTTAGDWSGAPQYATVTYDPYDGLVYAGACCAQGVKGMVAFDGQGHPVTLAPGAFSKTDYPMGIVVVP